MNHAFMSFRLKTLLGIVLSKLNNTVFSDLDILFKV